KTETLNHTHDFDFSSFVTCYCAHRSLHSFPTRRSSDLAAVGRDTFARTAKEFYRDNQIAARWIEKPGHATGTAGILVNAEGQNEIVVALGANAKLSAKDLPASLFKGAKLVVTQFETNPTAVAHTLRAGRAAGAITVFNPAPMRADFKPSVLKHVDVLIPNETEFTELVNLLPAT